MNELETPRKSTPAATAAKRIAVHEAEAAAGFVTPALWSRRRSNRSAGKVRPMVLLWALGVPLPIIAIIFLVRGCQ